jgi:hypothetical protein
VLRAERRIPFLQHAEESPTETILVLSHLDHTDGPQGREHDARQGLDEGELRSSKQRLDGQLGLLLREQGDRVEETERQAQEGTGQADGDQHGRTDPEPCRCSELGHRGVGEDFRFSRRQVGHVRHEDEPIRRRFDHG